MNDASGEFHQIWEARAASASLTDVAYFAMRFLISSAVSVSWVAWQSLAEQLVARVGDEHVVFNAHAQILFGNVDARFDGDHHSRLQRAAMVARIVYVEADMVAQAMNEILAERPALAVFPVRVDIVVGDVHQPIFLAAARKMRAGLESCERRVLRAKNDFVDFTLARFEPAARGKRAAGS